MLKRKILNSAGHSTLALGAIGALAFTTAHAQTAAPSQPMATTTDSKQVTEVIVRAMSKSTAPETVPLTVPYSESTITAEAIQNLTPQASLQTMLVSQPSIYTYQTGPNGVGANIFYRAFNSGQFAETYDGVAINDVFNGGVTGQASTWNGVLFIPANVDSVVLSRGINNPAVNSYNSLGGTINFLPKRPSDTFGGTIGASYGSFDSSDLSASLNTGSLAGVKSLLQVDYRGSNGWQANTLDRNVNAYYSGEDTLSNGNELSLVAVVNRNSGHEPFDMPAPLLQQDGKFYQYPLNESNETAADLESMVILGYKAELAPNVLFENKLFAGSQDFLRTSYGNPADSNSPYEIPDQAENYDYWLFYPDGPTYNPKTTFGSKAAGNAYHFYGYTTSAVGYTPTLTVSLPDNTIIAGGNVTFGQLHSREYWYGSEPVPQTLGYNDAWDEHDHRLFASAYIQDEIKVFGDTLTVTPGLKYEYAHTKDSDAIGFFYPYGGSVSDNESFTAPSLGVNYKPTDHLSFNFAFGQNIKFPDISAYYDAVPGTTSSTPLSPTPVKVKPEHVNDYELGTRYENGGFSVAFDVYREDFRSVFIDTVDATTFETIVSNGGSARYQGAEVQLNDDIKLATMGELKLYLNYAYNQARFTSSFVADSIGGSLSVAATQVTAGENMADVPNTLITGGFDWNYKGFYLNAEGRYVGRQLIIDEDTGAPSSTDIPGHFVMDLGLSKTIPLGANSWAKSLKLSVWADNVLNKYYYNEAYVQSSGIAGPTEFAAPGAPRSVMAKIEAAF